jgi:hypothetical protein
VPKLSFKYSKQFLRIQTRGESIRFPTKHNKGKGKKCNEICTAIQDEKRLVISIRGIWTKAICSPLSVISLFLGMNKSNFTQNKLNVAFDDSYDALNKTSS